MKDLPYFILGFILVVFVVISMFFFDKEYLEKSGDAVVVSKEEALEVTDIPYSTKTAHNYSENEGYDEETVEEEGMYYSSEYIPENETVYVYNSYANEPLYSLNSDGLTVYSGVNQYGNRTETYYSSNVAYHYMTDEWTAGDDGVYRDADGYVVVAASDISYGDVVDTSFGEGKVYDYCPTEGITDIYTNW